MWLTNPHPPSLLQQLFLTSELRFRRKQTVFDPQEKKVQQSRLLTVHVFL